MGNMTKTEFIREIAFRANFTIKDIDYIWGIVEEIFQEAIELEYELDLTGFGHLFFSDIKERWGNDLTNKQRVYYPKTRKVVFSLSKNLRDLAREPIKRHSRNTKKYREIVEKFNSEEEDTTE